MSERLDDLNLNGLKIYQETDYFCFGIDSVLLANFVKSKSVKNNVIELCAGSGVISVIFSAKKKFSKIIDIELQNEMFELLNKNIKYNGLEDKIITLQEDIKNIDNIKKEIHESIGCKNADVIICNPPYKKKGTGVTNENMVKYIARHEEKCTLEDIFKTSSKILKSKGKLYIVHKPDRLVDLFSIARMYKLEAKEIRFVHPKYNQAPSIVLVEYVKDGNNELKVLDPLIEYNEDGTYTDEINEIYGM